MDKESVPKGPFCRWNRKLGEEEGKYSKQQYGVSSQNPVYLPPQIQHLLRHILFFWPIHGRTNSSNALPLLRSSVCADHNSPLFPRSFHPFPPSQFSLIGYLNLSIWKSRIFHQDIFSLIQVVSCLLMLLWKTAIMRINSPKNWTAVPERCGWWSSRELDYPCSRAFQNPYIEWRMRECYQWRIYRSSKMVKWETKTLRRMRQWPDRE